MIECRAIYNDGSHEIYRGRIDGDTFKVRVTRPGHVIRFEFDEVASGFLVVQDLVVASNEWFPEPTEVHLPCVRVKLHPMS